MRYFGDGDIIDTFDLKTLMKQRVRSTTLLQSDDDVKLNCHDFTNWLGESIHQREGFYFRHDSVVNTKFIAAQKKREANMQENY
jgi:hypothetical protein